MLGRVSTKTAALEQGARGVSVNACRPGPIAERMIFKLAEEVFTGSKKTFAETVPLGRHGTPEDVAGLVSYLLFDDSELCDRHRALCRRRLHNTLIAFSEEYRHCAS